VQDERRPLGRRQGVEDDLHRVIHPFGEQRLGLRVDWRGLGDGRLCLGYRPGTPLAQMVQAQPGDDGCQPGGRVVDGFGTGEPKPWLLQYVVRVGI
jgi:hypothetical protein